jgi:hypothetical protein
MALVADDLVAEDFPAWCQVHLQVARSLRLLMALAGGMVPSQ